MSRTVFKPKQHSYAGSFKLLLVCLFVLPLQLMAQKRVSGTKMNHTLAKSLSHVFKKYELFTINAPDLALHAKSRKKGTVDFELDLPGYQLLPISLNEHNILSSTYQLVVGSEQGRQISASRDYKTYSGKVGNEDTSSVYLTISDKTIYGFIKGKGKEYVIEPLRYFDKNANANTFVFYEAKDVVPNSGTACAVTEVAEKDITPSTTSKLASLGTATGTCKMVEVAIASDVSMVAKYGTAAAVEEHNISVMNMMVGLYGNAQIGSQYLEFKINGQYISTTAGADPYTPAYSGPDASILLNNFTTWGQNGNFGFSYDVGQVWTARDIGVETYTGSGVYSYSVIGLAWTGGVCTSYKYQILEDAFSSSLAQAVTAAHETGHNLNANHDLSGDPYIMAPSINASSPATSFSATSIAAMNTYLSSPSVSCLGSCSSIQPIAQFNSSSANICTGNSVTFSNYSVGEITSFSWSFPGGSPSTSTAANPVVTYSTPGIKTATLSVTNANGTSTLSKNVFVANTPVTACRTSIAGNSELPTILSFSLAGIQHNNGTYWLGGRYSNFACTNNTQLQPATTYTVSTVVGYLGAPYDIKNKVQLFIDYNNDGDFLDADESIYNSSSCLQGSSSFTFTTPSSVSVKDTWLRLRFIAMPCSLANSNGCAIPSNAQIEDYAVYFADPCPVLTLPTAANTADVTVSGSTTVTLRTNSCELIASLLPNGANPVNGLVNAKVWIEPSVPGFAGYPFVARHYEITPAAGASTATGRVTLYFTQQEFDAFNAAPGSALKLPTGPADASGIANLRIGKYPGSSATGTGLPASYTGTPVVINPNDADIVWNNTFSCWDVSMDVTGFSGFIVQTSTTVLPLKLLAFQTALQNKDVVLHWLATEETNVSHFEIEHSTDGINFSKIGEVKARNKAGEQRYSFTDINAAIELAAHPTIYYRLKMADLDARSTYSVVSRVVLNRPLVINLYPNPVQAMLTIELPAANAGKVQLRLTDLQGRTIKTWHYSNTGAVLQLNLQDVASGVYQLEIAQGTQVSKTYKLVKQ